ncbi:peptidoglycan-binding protein [Calothrix sp. PCC 6303]|nr:Peptidoglycan-binding domain 1 protein [Calothrix sp. PCC 6303]
MRLCGSSILIIACLACLGLDTSSANAVNFKLAQAESTVTPSSSPQTSDSINLKIGTSGSQVEALQTQLKQLGFYDGVVDGNYGVSTRNSLSRFQAKQGLPADGILGKTTRERLAIAIKQQTPAIPTPNPTTEVKKKPQESTKSSILWWGLVFSGVLGTCGAIAYTINRFSKPKLLPATLEVIDAEAETIDKTYASTADFAPRVETYTEPQYLEATEKNSDNIEVIDTIPDSQDLPTSSNTELLAPEKTSRLIKVSIVEELVNDLRSQDPNKRRKAVWDLGQQGDSRAIEPLLDLMIDVDSQQRSLILAALAEICTRTLKPINRALAISLQDESPEVRQNGIRDLTRVYDMMTQVSQMLYHALEDPNAEVQATAKYALAQMNRIRSIEGNEGFRD